MRPPQCNARQSHIANCNVMHHVLKSGKQCHHGVHAMMPYVNAGRCNTLQKKGQVTGKCNTRHSAPKTQHVPLFVGIFGIFMCWIWSTTLQYKTHCNGIGNSLYKIAICNVLNQDEWLVHPQNGNALLQCCIADRTFLLRCSAILWSTVQCILCGGVAKPSISSDTMVWYGMVEWITWSNLAGSRLPPRSGVRGRRYVIHRPSSSSSWERCQWWLFWICNATDYNHMVSRNVIHMMMTEI